jgi:outer membrane protein assembly factor BamB
MPIRLSATGDITPTDISETNTAIAWVHPRQGSYLQTPIVVGDLLYSCRETGVLTCFNAHSGRIHFSERLAGGSQGFSASPVSDGQHLYFTSELGDVYVLPVGPEFSITATNSMGEVCMASPAISDGMLLFRTREHLVAIGKR